MGLIVGFARLWLMAHVDLGWQVEPKVAQLRAVG